MTFNSLAYLLYLPIVYLIFYFTAGSWRWLVLLVASYAFYSSLNAPYLLAVLLVVTCISYACGFRIAAHKDEAIRRRWLWTGIFACVATLVVMKYLPLIDLITTTAPFPATLISIGVSYFTFQAISYLVDIYLEIEQPEHHLGYFALYMAFFPKLLQGPVERAHNLLPQLKKRYVFDYEAMRSGMLLFSFGMFKKVVIAERLAAFVNPVYNDVHAYKGIPLVIATYAYALQIYFDFAGYTDMARGTARLFGIDLTENFDGPYGAISISDFWRRWHISFSRWIMDYIFNPLHMILRYQGRAGLALALIATFLISGIWHGAGWGFMVWGLLHGIYLVVSTYYKPYEKKLHHWMGSENNWLFKSVQISITFNLVVFAWIFFRASTINNAWYVVTNIPNIYANYILLSKVGIRQFCNKYIFYGGGFKEVSILILSLLAIHCIKKISISPKTLFDRNIYIRWSAYCTLILFVYLFGIYNNNTFIYFNF